MKFLITIFFVAALVVLASLLFVACEKSQPPAASAPPDQTRVIGPISTNGAAEGTNTSMLLPDSENSRRIDRMVDKMAGTLVQLGKPVDVSLPPATKPRIPKETMEADSTSTRYDRLWNKLERNQNAVRE